MHIKKTSNLALLAVFAIAMAYMEAMIVVYIRRLLGIDGPGDIGGYLSSLGITDIQAFSLFLREKHVMFEEQTREFATILMLVSVSLLAGKTRREKFAVFLWIFALWDIFYYIFLYILIKWPPSIMAIDCLFLIPAPWMAPVIVPVAISTVMAIAGGILYLKEANPG